MKTISSLVRSAVIKQPFLVQMLKDELVNLSSLARKLKPVIDAELHKNIQTGSIVMALKRLTVLLQGQEIIQSKKIANLNGDLNVRLNLSIYTFENSRSIILAHRMLLDQLSQFKNIYYTVSRGINKTAIVINSKYGHILEETFRNEVLLVRIDNLSSITLKLKEEYAKTPGVYHLIFSKLAWHGVNVRESFSTTYEISVFIDDKDTSLAFSCIKELMNVDDFIETEALSEEMAF